VTLSCGSLFSGAGLLDLGLMMAGVRHEWFVEASPSRREILGARWPGVPVFDDVRTAGAEQLERVGLIAGGFPCKGASNAGPRTGFGHPETALWAEFARIVGELRPRYVAVENVGMRSSFRRGSPART
jgi:DNA (cytosine-5)-methyltransferase 1